MWLTRGVKTAFSAESYIERSIDRIARMMDLKTFPSFKTPMSDLTRPELDDSPFLSPVEHSKFRSLVGCANWLVNLGRFDIAYAVNTLSRFSM